MSPAASASPGIVDLPAYVTVLAQCFCPTGQHLLLGDARGRVVAMKTTSLVNTHRQDHARQQVAAAAAAAAAASDDLVVCRFRLNRPDGRSLPVLAMAATKAALLIGSVGEVSAWPWSDLWQGRPQRAWTLAIPPQAGAAVETEVNDLSVDETSGTAGRLIVAGGDNLVHIYDLETRREIRALKGHEDYLHGVSHCPTSGLIASGSEDGTVRLWDAQRSARPQTAKIQPSEKASLARPKLGKWVGAVSLAPEWLACGGGPRASLWHLRTLSPSDPLPPSENDSDNGGGIHVVKIVSDRVIIGGQTKTMYQTSLTGEILAEVDVSSSCIYSIVCREEPVKMLSCAGSSSRVDICAPNFSYKDQTIMFPSF